VEYWARLVRRWNSRIERPTGPAEYDRTLQAARWNLSEKLALAVLDRTGCGVTSEMPNEAGLLRRQAERALRLARSISDETALRALKVLAATLSERAASLEQHRPAQQQQQVKDEDQGNVTCGNCQLRFMPPPLVCLCAVSLFSRLHEAQAKGPVIRFASL
jgi:hypothetical protein